MRSSLVRSKTQGPLTQAWILLAYHDSRAIQYARRCKACQIHADFIHQPPELLHPTVASWPFEAWRIDVIGPISPSSTKDYRFILAITDYFSKWAEAVPLVEVKTSNVVNFIKHHIIHRFGVPKRIINDNGPQFVSQVFYPFCDKYRIQNVASTAITLLLIAWQKHSTR